MEGDSGAVTCKAFQAHVHIISLKSTMIQLSHNGNFVAGNVPYISKGCLRIRKAR